MTSQADDNPGMVPLSAVIEKLAASKGEASLTGRERRARSVARLAAVQALYQMEMAGVGVEAVIREFRDFRFEADLEGGTLAQADETFFADLVRGVVADQDRIDAAIVRRLASGWRLDRLDATVRALLRVGTQDIMSGLTPKRVALDEYVELAKAFFDQGEARFINGALDAVARDLA